MKECLNIGERVICNCESGFYDGYIGTIKYKLEGGGLSIGVLIDGHLIEFGYSASELKPFKSKYEWKYGDNGVQEYYDVMINGKYLLVFRNKTDKNYKHWMCSIDNVMIENKTRNNYYRRKKRATNLFSHHCLLQGSPSYLIKKVEYCFEHSLTEISA